MKKRKLRNTRPEAFWGAVIGAAASLLGSAISSKGASDSASSSADAIIQASRENARALQQQNENNNRLQQQSQDFIKAENERNRQIQRDLQMSMQLQGGQLSADERRMASRIQVKKGGKVSRKKLRDAVFYGGGNLPFHVTDGGGVLPLRQTPEGYDLYEIIGNDHNHYHKTRSGKYKTGVGIAFDSPDYGNERLMQTKGGKATKVVEGEGNQNTSQGEYLLVTPDSGMFISKHSINGFNPVQAVNAGMHPLMAYNVQEASKGTSPVKKNRYKATAGISSNYVLPTDYNIDTIMPISPRRSLKKGGRCKALYGYGINPIYDPNANWYLLGGQRNGYGGTMSNGVSTNNVYSTTPYNNSGTSYNNNSTYSPKTSRWNLGLSGNLIGAGITSLGNIGGAILTNWGASRASRLLNNAYGESGKLLADAYDNLKTVDISNLSRDIFRHQHFLPVVRSATYNVNPDLEEINRNADKAIIATNANTLSSAARLARLSGINANTTQFRSKVFGEKGNKEEAIKQENMNRINEAAAKNAELDVQSSRDFTAHYLDLLKYNNDIVNERITGRAQALADAMTNGAGARAAYLQSAGQSWGNAIAGSGQAFGNAFAIDAKQRADIEMARLSASRSGELSYLRRFGSSDEINREVARLNSIINNPSTTPDFKEQAIRDRNYLLGSWT